MTNNEIIELLEDGKVKVSYIEPALDIKNKKNNVVGVRDITYDAVYNNKSIAVNMFKEKISEHKAGIKKIEGFQEENKEELDKIKHQMKLNDMSLKSLKGLIEKTESITKKIQEL